MDVARAGSPSVGEEVAQLLGISAAELAPDVDLISQGLDSIRMMSLSGRWRKRGIDIDFATLAANPTVQAWTMLVGTSLVDDTQPSPSAAEHTERQNGTGADTAAESFSLAPMQHAMWVGRNDNQDLGGVAGHLYVEFDGTGVDPGRLSSAARLLARRHPMLRVEFGSDGTQRIGERELAVDIEDLRDLGATHGAHAVEDHLRRTRDTKSHQQLDGAVFQLSLSLLPDNRTRVHVDLDMQAADAVSYRTLMTDLARLYRGEQLPELGYTYRDYRAAISDHAGSRPRDADRQWWAERIPEMSDAPALPLVPRAQQVDPRRSTRRHHWLDPQARDALYAAAQHRGITPAMAIAASFAGTLARWSTSPRFLLNIPMFGREPLHEDVERLVGDFTSSLLLDVDFTETRNAAGRARSLQRTMHAAAARSSYPGLSVLRDLGGIAATGAGTCCFHQRAGAGELFSTDVTDAFGSPVWILSQGPQVLLDAQVTEFNDGVLVNWDVREDAFRPGVIDAMFAHHVAELGRLAFGSECLGGNRSASATRRPAGRPGQCQQRNRHQQWRSAAGRLLCDGYQGARCARGVQQPG